MKEKIAKRIEEIKVIQKDLQDKMTKCETERQELIKQFLATQGAVQELEGLVRGE
jgi:hypothetical protein